MPTGLRVSTLRVLFITGTLSAATGAAAQTTAPVIYQGIPHTAIGTAVLQPDSERNTLDVRTSDPNGGDGVAMRLRASTTDWTAHVGTENGGLPLVMTLNAIADGQRISTSVLREVDDRIVLGAQFTGGTRSSFAALVYNKGTLVASLGGLPPTAQVHFPSQLPCEFLENGCSFFARFRNTVYGECEWVFVFGGAGRITLPNGQQVTGDEVRLVEEVRPAGHYPYLSFDGVTLQTNARVLTLFAESAR